MAVAVNLAPFPKQQFNQNGVPLAGGKLFTYAAGTTNKLATYTDSTGTVPNTNPIILDSNGQCDVWLQTGLNYKLVLSPATDTDPPTNPFWTEDNVQGGVGAAAVTIDGVSLSTQFQSRVNRVVDSISALRGLSKATYNRAWVTGYNAAGDGGGGAYWYDPTDTTSTDNGGTVIVASDGGRWKLELMSNYVSAAQFGAIPDGTTDRTSLLTGMLSALGTAGFRGVVRIAYNTKFTVTTVFTAVPTGIILQDDSSINWGQPPGYKNKFRITYSGDTVSDDTQTIIASNHHPAIQLNNFGGAGSTAANNRYASILYAYGQKSTGDPALSFLDQVSKNTDNNTWYRNIRLETPYNAGLGSQGQWVTGHAYTSGQYVTNGSYYYIAASSGTSGATPPTWTSGTQSDGGVSWTTVGLINPDTRLWVLDENGRMGINSVPGITSGNYIQAYDSALVATDTETYVAAFNNKNSSRAGFRFSSKTSGGTARQCVLRVNESGQVVLYDETAGSTLFTFDPVSGFQFGSNLPSNNFQTLSGASPTLTTSAGYVNNGSATNMTGMSLPGTQTRAEVTLLFANANTTVTTSGFTLKGGSNVTPPANGIMVFVKDPNISGNWIEKSRSF